MSRSIRIDPASLPLADSHDSALDCLLDFLGDIDATEAVDLDVINAVLRGEISGEANHADL